MFNKNINIVKNKNPTVFHYSLLIPHRYSVYSILINDRELWKIVYLMQAKKVHFAFFTLRTVPKKGTFL